MNNEAPGKPTVDSGERAVDASEPVAILENVHLRYPGSRTEALAGVSLSIGAGEHVCILGGNGSGKSTLLQLLNVLTLPSAGRVRMFGVDTSDPARALDIRRRTATVFQHPEDQMVTSIVADDVAFGPENLCVPQPQITRRVDGALAAVDMAGRSQSDPADLSGGQMQRVAIAGALAMEPEVLLLDEPCAMLDVEGRAAVRELIVQANAGGITVVHVTHFAEDALAARRAIVLDRGRVAYDGEPAEAVRLLGLDRDAAVEGEATGTLRANSKDPAAPNGKHGGSMPRDAEPAVTFDHVSFSYAAAKNPRRRERMGLLGGPFRGGKRNAGKAQAAASDRGPANGTPLALSDLSFRAYPGTLTALIGRTGSGKSTTAELACALKLPLEGSVRVHGIGTADLARRRELRRLVGYVSQLPERQLFAETVFDDVAFGPRNLGLPKDEVASRVRDALSSVNLDPTDDLLGRSPFALSGGQQRGVAIAGVLAMRQPVLVLDEPMAGLDPAGRAQVRGLIQRLKREGTALIMVTHSMADVAALADQVIALENGRAVACDAPEEVLATLATTRPCTATGEGGFHGAAR